MKHIKKVFENDELKTQFIGKSINPYEIYCVLDRNEMEIKELFLSQEDCQLRCSELNSEWDASIKKQLKKSKVKSAHSYPVNHIYIKYYCNSVSDAVDEIKSDARDAGRYDGEYGPSY